MCTRNALPNVLEEFAAKDPSHMAELSGAKFENNVFSLSYCNLPLQISYPDGDIKLRFKEDKVATPVQLTNDEKVIILHYLSRSSGLPLRGQWISFLELGSGQMHWSSFQKEVLEPLSREYGSSLDLFFEKGQEYGGTPFSGGDAGLIIPVFPKVPVAYLLWRAGDEFPSRAQALFDSAAGAYFTTATLFVLAKQALTRVWFTDGSKHDHLAEEV